jgi:6,7-dimethyl-8-ribityllumazine synthase
MSPAEGREPAGEVAALGLLDGTGLRVAVACGRFNREITDRLLEGALSRLSWTGVAEGDVETVWVPGAFELPAVADACARSGAVDAVICLGAVIRGETGHYDLIAGECAAGLQRVQLDTGVPVVFGVLTTEDHQQALERSGGRHGHKGEEAAETAVEMVNTLRRLRQRLGGVAGSAAGAAGAGSARVAGTGGGAGGRE